MKATTLILLALTAALLAAPAAPCRADLYADLAEYTYGDDSKAAEKLEQLVKETKPGNYAPIEAKLIEIVQSKNATQDGKAFACRALQQIGTPKAVPALAGLLDDKVLSHYARLALERMTGCPASVQALRNALATAPDCVKPGLMGSLAVRKDAEAVDEIARLIGSSDRAVAAGALDALGKIATRPAQAALAKANVPDALKSKRLESLILCDATLGDAAALHKVYAECPCPVQKSAALAALVRLDDAKAAVLVVEAIKAKPSTLRQAALQMIVTAPSGKLTTAMVSALGSFEPATRAHVAELLGKRGDEAALPALVKACEQAKDDALRTAAGKAVAELGGPEHVRMLLGLPNGPAIVRPMAADGVDDALIALLDDKGLRVAAIQALAQRRTGKAADRIIALTGDADEAIRASAWSALPDVATEDEAAKITPLMIKLPDGPERDRATGALRALISGASSEAKNKVFQQLAGHYKTADTKMRQYILSLGPAFATKEALAMETDALQGGNDGEQDKALQALSAWPNPDPCPALLKTADEGKAKTQKILALRAYLELSAKDGSNEKKIERFTKATRLLERPEEKRLLISKLRNIHHPESLKLAATFFDDTAVVKEAQNAAMDIIARLRGRNADVSMATLKQIIETSRDKKITKRAGDILKGLSKR